MSKDAYYFSHDSNARNDQRLMKIRMEYGMKGYGIYFGVIEILREQTEYCLSLDDIKGVAFDLREEESILEDIILNYELFNIEDKKFYSRSLKRRMERLDMIKQKRADAGRIGGKSKAYANQLPSKESKVKDNKVKDSKVKEINIENRLDKFKRELSNFKKEFGEESLIDFFNYWTEPNKSNTKLKFEMQPTWDTKRRIQRWVGNDFNSNKTNGISKFRLDSTGNAYIGYCSKCNKSDFYDKMELKQDSRCCKSKILSEVKKNV